MNHRLRLAVLLATMGASFPAMAPTDDGGLRPLDPPPPPPPKPVAPVEIRVIAEPRQMRKLSRQERRAEARRDAKRARRR